MRLEEKLTAVVFHRRLMRNLNRNRVQQRSSSSDVLKILKVDNLLRKLRQNSRGLAKF